MIVLGRLLTIMVIIRECDKPSYPVVDRLSYRLIPRPIYRNIQDQWETVWSWQPPCGLFIQLPGHQYTVSCACYPSYRCQVFGCRIWFVLWWNRRLRLHRSSFVWILVDVVRVNQTHFCEHWGCEHFMLTCSSHIWHSVTFVVPRQVCRALMATGHVPPTPLMLQACH